MYTHFSCGFSLRERRLMGFAMGASTEAPKPEDNPEVKSQEETVEPLDLENPEASVKTEVQRADKEVQKNRDKVIKNLESNIPTQERHIVLCKEMLEGEKKNTPPDAVKLKRMEERINNAEEKLHTMQLELALMKFDGKLEAGSGPEEAFDEAADGTPDDAKTEKGDIKKEALQKLIEKMNLTPDQAKAVEGALDKFKQETIAFFEGLQAEYATIPEEDRNTWLSEKMDAAPEAVKKDIEAIVDAITATPGRKPKPPEKNKILSTDVKDQMKEFGKALKELFEMIREFLVDAGIIKDNGSKLDKDNTTDVAGDVKLDNDVRLLLTSSKETTGKDAKADVAKLEKRTGAHIKDAEKGVDNAKLQRDTAVASLATVDTEITALEAAVGGTPAEQTERATKLADLRVQKTELQISVVQAEALVTATEARVTQLKAIKTKLDGATAKLNLFPENQKIKMSDVMSGRVLPAPPAAPAPAPPPAPGAPGAPKSLPVGWKEGADGARLVEWEREQGALLARGDKLNPVSRDTSNALKRSGVIVADASAVDPVRVAINGSNWDMGRGPANMLVMRNVDKPEISVILPDGADLSPLSLKRYAAQAEKNQEKQDRDEAEMGKGFEVADSAKPMAYIEVYDGADPGTADDHKGHAGFPDMLGQRYKVVTSPTGAIDGSKEDPIAAIRSRVTALSESGVKQFYLMTLGHGSEGKLHFGPNAIRPADLLKVFADFPDCKFTMNGNACFGGGMANAMKGFKDKEGAPKGRVSVFTQTKPDVSNIASRTAEGKFSTVYNAALSKYLLQGVGGRPGAKLTYGEAHLLADKEAKKLGFCDAEVHASRPGDNSAYTAGINNGPSAEGMA